LRLVTANAKIFNPSGSIYYAEAERIEAWGLDHIAKAAPTVIQYEADWNIDVEKDDESHLVDIDNDDDVSMDVESVHDDRSASVVSQPIPGPSRRGPRGPYKKGASTSVAESIEADGHLPGAKDGLGAFPPCSDWARTVLQLKIKGNILFI
jgi:bromodomain-containing protein 7/9